MKGWSVLVPIEHDVVDDTSVDSDVSKAGRIRAQGATKTPPTGMLKVLKQMGVNLRTVHPPSVSWARASSLQI